MRRDHQESDALLQLFRSDHEALVRSGRLAGFRRCYYRLLSVALEENRIDQAYATMNKLLECHFHQLRLVNLERTPQAVRAVGL